MGGSCPKWHTANQVRRVKALLIFRAVGVSRAESRLLAMQNYFEFTLRLSVSGFILFSPKRASRVD
jgi:hypothetical protein